MERLKDIRYEVSIIEYIDLRQRITWINVKIIKFISYNLAYRQYNTNVLFLQALCEINRQFSQL